MEETPTETTAVDAILDALAEAIQKGDLERAGTQLEHLRRELAIERGSPRLAQTDSHAPPSRRDYPPGD